MFQLRIFEKVLEMYHAVSITNLNFVSFNGFNDMLIEIKLGNK